MLIKVGDKIKTDYCSGVVTEVIDGSTKKGWKSMPYFVIRVTSPRVDWRRKKTHIVRMDEVKAKS